MGLKVGWARVVSIVDEAATALVRTAFSSLVREMHDFSCGLFDAQGRLLASSTLGSPALAGMIPTTVKHFIAAYGADLVPGDVILTNDPWLANGHLNDLTVAEPIFHAGRVVGWAGCAVHVADIGGLGATVRSQDVYEEGLRLPICKIVRAGQPNQDIWEIVRANVRSSEQVVGDMRSQLAAMHVMAERVGGLLDEFSWADLSAFADAILERTTAATERAIRQIPEGRYEASLRLDGYAAGADPIDLVVALIVRDGRITLDFTGTSPEQPRSVNAPLNVIRGYGVFPLKCVLDPASPLNEGFTRCIDVIAPAGTVVNARHPAPVWGRMLVGYFLSELVFSALAAVVPERVLAASGGTPQWLNFFDGERSDGTRFVAVITPQGGLGARSGKDGISTLAWPANLAMVPVEILEHEAPLLCEEKSLITDSGGAGRFRGGLGQQLILSVREGSSAPRQIRVSVRGGRLVYPGQGLGGGAPTPLGDVRIGGEAILYPTVIRLGDGERLVYRVPGGAGFYDPATRDPEAVARDVANGYVSAEAARSVYRVVLSDQGIDTPATIALRAAGSAIAASAKTATTNESGGT
jgi:N-methylhydantoinase B/oxoprolinase/acetone carboxylase alpha subunit